MIKKDDIIEILEKEIKENNYVKESKIVYISKDFPIIRTIREDRRFIQELTFAVLDSEKEGKKDLYCTAVLFVLEDDENYCKYKALMLEQ